MIKDPRGEQDADEGKKDMLEWRRIVALCIVALLKSYF